MLLRTFFLRPVRRRPLRFLTTVLGVAAGIAAVVATISSSQAAVASLREGVTEIAGRTRLEVTAPAGVPEDLLGTLRPLAGDAVVVPVIEEIALVPALGDAVRVLGVDPLLDAQVRTLEISAESGTPLEVAREMLAGRGVLVPAPLAARLGLKVGDVFEVSVRARRESLTVAGVFTPKRFASAWDRVLIVDVALAQEMFGRVGRVDRIELVPRRGVTLGRLAESARTLLPPDVRVEEPAERGAGTSRMVRALQFNLTALSGVSLVVGAVLVATTLATSVVQRRTALAIARSLGGSRRQLATVVLAEALAIGALGGTLGVAGGLLGARAALASVRSTVAAAIRGVPATAIQLPSGLAAAGLLLGVLVSLAAAALPLAEAVATPPVQGLASEHPAFLGRSSRRRAALLAVIFLAAAVALARAPAWHDLPVAALLGSLALLGALLVAASPALDALARRSAGPLVRGAATTPLRLAVAALAAGRRRASWAAGAVGVAVALAVAIGTMVHSFRATVVDWANQGMRADIWVRPMAASTGVQVGRLDPEVVRTAERLFGTSVIDPFHTAQANMRGVPVTLGAGVFAVVARRGGVPFRDGRDSRAVFAAALRHHAAVVNEPFANRFGVKEGDTLRLEVPGGELVRTVEAVFFDYSHQQGMVVIDRNDFLRIYPDDGPSELALFLPPGQDPAAARERLLAALGGRFLVEALLNRELRAEVVGIFDRTFAITRALQAVAVAVAVLAVLTVLFALLGERRRDLALLRAVGASRAQVATVVAAQAALLGLTGAAGGLGIGLAIGLVLVKVVNLQSFGWTLRFLPPWPALAATALLVTLACLVAGLAPALAAARMHPSEDLREEG
ncbi:MAG TPA: FtsX-like permease family protein [Thermoanaerobaculaceae bacterium]|nr:FtsX-like permease family protein [Thermoanaerobaculaceae bacterium]